MMDTTEIPAGGLAFRANRAGPAEGAGKGAAVIFLHGFPNSRHSWDAQMQGVAAAGYHGVAYDQRGYAPGARPTGIAAYHVDHIVQDVLNVADAIGATRFHLVGHDWGGQIAWLTAIAHPDRLQSLTVLSRPHPAAFARAFQDDPEQAGRSGHHKRFQDPAMADTLLADDMDSLRNTLTWEGGGTFASGGGNRKRRMSDAQAEAHLSVLRDPGALDAALNWYRAAFGGGSTLARADAPGITVPTLYIWGSEDGTVGRMAAAGTGDFIDAPYRFLEVEGAGHFLAEEAPEKITQALLTHLETHDG